MREVFFWPYDEVQCDRTPSGIHIRSPWIEASLLQTEDNAQSLDELTKVLKSRQLTLESARLVSEYFQPLNEHSLCYFLPSALPEELDATPKDGPLAPLSFNEVVAAVVGSNEALNADEKTLATQACAAFSYEWAWDTDAAIAFSSVGEKVHPQSLFSVVRRYHLLSLFENDFGGAILSEIEKLPDAEFKSAVLALLRQNHYVTQRCERSLRPALETSGRARPKIESFMKEERGHDRILALGFKEFGVEAEQISVSPIARALMCFLEYSAGHNFLAFAMAVDFFERRSYGDEEPLAKLFGSRGFSEAAKRLNQHKHINDAGEHHDTALGFLEWMGACEPAYAREALRLAEATSFLMTQLTRASYEMSRS